MKGKKITTKPVTYEIEILDVSREIPIDKEIEFIEWIDGQTNEGLGKRYENFHASDDFTEDIWVTFYVKKVY